MFTGLVESQGTVTEVEDLGDSVRITIADDVVLADAGLGDSIAVNGCCLTVVRLADPAHPASFAADVMAETLAKTTVGSLRAGDRVNLERAVRADQRLGGHIVQGHVDGVGRVRHRAASEHWEVVEFDLPPDLARYLVPKGSITVDGVSLTVVEAGSDHFSVSLIPETLARTSLGIRAVGDPVNLEVDVLGKYVARYLDPILAAQSATSPELTS